MSSVNIWVTAKTAQLPIYRYALSWACVVLLLAGMLLTSVDMKTIETDVKPI